MPTSIVRGVVTFLNPRGSRPAIGRLGELDVAACAGDHAEQCGDDDEREPVRP